ncbi:ribonuclease H2, subunit B [Lineolata rhizophorae]|uniref:Ribonuclease H2 subunit B n=1 Tax=Lineolata rhizophorae TaxID=578093 RepID=A0A6A6NPN1_9PEZI|nr:ribonuclease H2, subunit B [Lineolata rhizophorae]
MPPKTRSRHFTKSTPKPKSSDSTNEQPKSNALPPPDQNPPKLFILPNDASSEARIVTLRNPATGRPNRYYVCPTTGRFFEFTRIAPPKNAWRGMLLTPEHQEAAVRRDENSEGRADDDSKEGNTGGSDDVDAKGQSEQPASENEETGCKWAGSEGYVLSDPGLFIATPLDPLFLVLPALAPKPTTTSNGGKKAPDKQMFLSVDDYIDALLDANASNNHLKDLLASHPGHRAALERRISAACDTVDAGDEKMYRLSVEKVVAELLAKATRMVEKGLPKSMEERFVNKTLEVPVMAVKREGSGVSFVGAGKKDEGHEEEKGEAKEDGEESSTATPTEDSQTSTNEASTTASATINASTTVTTPASTSTNDWPSSDSPLTPSDQITHLLRLRTALSFLTTSYLPAHLRDAVTAYLTTTPPPAADFRPLTAHLARLDSLRAEAAALRSLSDNIARKRAAGTGEDEEAAAEREERKRKKEEEEQRKKAESRAVKQLKKADTSGMKKLSSFFGKATAKK